MLQDTNFWVAVSFVIFVALAYKPAMRQIGGALDGRADRIRQQIEDAQKLREDAQALLASYKRKQRDALQEAEEIVAHAREESKRQQQQAEADLEALLKRREAQALEKIAQAEAKALQEVREKAVDVAIAATRLLLDEKLDAKASNTLIDNAIGELPNKLH
ncbi:F0F1 ATP synthase subunit B family protein [Oceanibaculum nanhaiense]|uniref:F0F1 ATP synthase subunit B family protein n=1 Tax=Oceanibaculum nanhaiense TaxID=1909734 RepID=UPI000A3D22EE|nr:F0F1 ATP synthase subunit B [Oceanibaculum nanhaiense]MBC7135818.1 F0F1 ATP synthase subunit B [Oceanibaculum nanhaiense]MDM7945188.1 F0F1 ATP synthase subunit B [Oceanibaculum nanhaiense]